MATETTKTAKDVAVTRSDETKQIILPKGLKLTEAADMILRLDKAEDKTVAILHEFDCFPLDGAVAFRAALEAWRPHGAARQFVVVTHDRRLFGVFDRVVDLGS